VTTIDFPDSAGVVDVAILVLFRSRRAQESRHIYFTLDPSTWDGLDFISAEQGTDNLVGFSIVAGPSSGVFCENHTEKFATTGDADAPLHRGRRVFDKAPSPEIAIVISIIRCLVGNDGIVYRGAGAPQRVPTMVSRNALRRAASEIMHGPP